MEKNEKSSTKCFLCGSNPRIQLSHAVVLGKPTAIYYCPKCEAYFENPKPSEKELFDFYGHEYFKNVSTDALLAFLKSEMAPMRAASQCRFISEKIRLGAGSTALEIGAADGSLLAYFKKRGFNVRGLEYNRYMIGSARKKYGIALEPTDFMSAGFDEKFDLVIMSHVLEHFRDPLAVLEKCRRIIKPGKYLFLEVPNSPKPAEADGKTLRHYLETPHLTNYRIKSMKIMLQKQGFEPLVCARYSNAPRFFPALSRQIGDNFMKGRLFGSHPAETIVSAGFAWLCHKMGGDTYYPIDAEAWQGYSDFIRVIAKKT